MPSALFAFYVALGWTELAILMFAGGFTYWHYWKQRGEVFRALWYTVSFFFVLVIAIPALLALLGALLSLLPDR